MKRVVLLGVVLLALGASEAQAEYEPSPLPSPARTTRCGKASAPEAINYVWYEMRDRVGARFEVTPRFHFVPGPYLEMQVEGNPVRDYPEIAIARWSRLSLTGVFGCLMKREAEESLVHEFAHVYQQSWVRSGETSPGYFSEAIPEGLAEAFAENVMKEVFGFGRRDYEREWNVYNAYAREMRQRYPPAFINRGQFGTNWGLDPTMISF